MALPIENEAALREFLMQQFSATPDSAGLEEALAADRQRTVDSQKAAMFSQAAALMRNEKVPTLQPQQSDSAFREWLMRQRVQDQGAERKIQAAGALAKLDRAPELDAQPAPPEWNALPGMTRSEALRAGYGRPAADKTGAPLTPEEVDEAARLRIAYDGRDPEKVRDDLYGERRSVRNAEAQRFARDATAAKADEKDERKRSDDTFIADDFEPGPSARPVESSVKTDLFRQASNGSSIIKNSRELRALVKKHGGGAVAGPVASRMSALATDLVMGGKNLYGLGVLNPNDEVVLARIIADPTSISSLVKDASGVRSLDAIYGALEDVTKRRVVDAFRQAGHSPRPGSVFAAPASSTGGGRVRVISPDGTRGTIDASELDAALANGWRRADG